MELKDKIVNAGKWSTVTELCAKLVAPVSSMVLARVLTPAAFGVVATVTMIITFVEIFTDAGFQKYIVQHEFENDDELNRGTNVAFWSNLALSLFLWAVIFIFQEPLAVMVGNPGLGYVITIACVSIPLNAFSSIQMALYKRFFDFKTLFKVRIVGLMVPLLVTIPLAFWLRSYWALIIGTISANLCNAVILTYFSSWKPRLYYSWQRFKDMFSFTSWSMFEGIAIWMTGYVDIFIIGVHLNEYYLGVYKTSMSTVGQITGLITSITTPILFSSLSRVQNDRKQFRELFFKFQKLVSIFIMPLGIGLFCYSRIAVDILLGSQWLEACGFIGLWGLTSSWTIVFAHYCSEAYRSIGRPKLSVLAQVLHIIVLWPAVLIAVKYGFDALFVTRSLVRLELILVNVILMGMFVKITFSEMLSNCNQPLLASLCMLAVGLFINYLIPGLWGLILSAFISTTVYFLILNRNKEEHGLMMNVLVRVPGINKFFKSKR